MTIFFDPAIRNFLDDAVHPAIPDRAVAITEADHRRFLTARCDGHAIEADAAGRPRIVPRVVPLDARRAAAIAGAKAEARRRILSLAPIEQQANDNALLAQLAIHLATGEGVVDPDAADAASARRRRIDAIRAASNAIEATIATLDEAALAALTLSDDHHWPSDKGTTA